MLKVGRAIVCFGALLGCGRIGFAENATSAPDGSVRSDAGPTPLGATCGDGRIGGTEICDDGNLAGGDGCSADCSEREICGDSMVTGDEECDDGNAVRGDGCEATCVYSCAGDPTCDDGDPCNGTETCNAIHACEPGAPETDGTPCGGTRSCRGGTCALASCGDGSIDAGEDCDDENLVAADGCENDCSFSCTGDCEDGDVCNGAESCVDHVCTMGTAAATGSECDRDANPETRDLCLDGGCVRSICGDRYVDSPDEECDDGNIENGDGCDNDCRFSCRADPDCSDGDVCDGAERCDDARHACVERSPAADGTPCPGGSCRGGACEAASDAGPRDAGSPGSDGGICAPTAPLSCFKACTTHDDCVVVEGDCCCGCSGGGFSDAINRSQLDAFAARQMAMCPRPRDCGLCTDVYNCLPGALCTMGQCEASDAI